MYYTIWYNVSSIILGILLYFPTRKFILSINVNRHQSKAGRDITDDELAKLKKKVTIISVVVAVTFAFLYNKFIMFKYIGAVSG